MIEAKAQKNTQHCTDRTSEISHIDVPVICPVCGSEMSRRHDNRFTKRPQRWVCSNAKCHTIIHKIGSNSLDDITVLLNQVIVNPELVQISAKDESIIVQTLKDVEFKAMLQAIATDTVEEFDGQRATALMAVKNSLEQQLAQFDNAQQAKENTQSRLDEIFTILNGLENHPMDYDDRLVRQVLECIVVESKRRSR
ncbi:hypothetical protein D7X94_06915 [Acutalibacter sp. 1XD8-33]|uniref:hypothetical protein n=1 Tax=Acutalibacter sp. 1XD8-33 TaxID=2320081 RepID=UPI000EA25F1B|nr:hypothetical protein [Acutalibacter sp. 1XD8-33]RKJ40782.1 hypothetical protein D7X94_06915 [Acutalibacter sp. 1XD8-33]